MSIANPKDSSRVRGDARARRLQRQQEADERQIDYEELSIEQRLAKLDARGVSATKERQRLLVKLQGETTKGKKGQKDVR